MSTVPSADLGTALRRTRWLVLAVVALATACGSGRRIPPGDPFSEQGVAADIRLRVQNMNFYDATLTAISDTGRRRLGNVGGNQTAVFTMPWEFSSGLRIEIDLLAGPSCTTLPIVVNPGDVVTLQIQTDFDNTCR